MKTPVDRTNERNSKGKTRAAAAVGRVSSRALEAGLTRHQSHEEVLPTGVRRAVGAGLQAQLPNADGMHRMFSHRGSLNGGGALHGRRHASCNLASTIDAESCRFTARPKANKPHISHEVSHAPATMQVTQQPTPISLLNQEGIQPASPGQQPAMHRERTTRADAPTAAYSSDEFLAVVTHELRSPLNAIRGWAHVLRQGGNLSPLQIKALDTIDRNTDVQARLVDDLLDSQRILSGDFRLLTSRVSLATLVNDAVETLQPVATARQIQLEVHHDPRLDTISVDPTRLNQALVRLLSNAIKVSPECGSVHVHTAHRAPWVEITVRDEGHGLSAEQLPQVFNRYQQAGPAQARQKAGLGLGLSLAQQLIELHGGQIKANSPGTGLGSTFTLQLPDHLADDLLPASDHSHTMLNTLASAIGSSPD